MKWRIRILVRGKVQGVFFRFNTKRRAEKLGLNGWVKNVHSDKVEIVAVDHLEFTWEKDNIEKFKNFEIRYSEP